MARPKSKAAGSLAAVDMTANEPAAWAGSIVRDGRRAEKQTEPDGIVSAGNGWEVRVEEVQVAEVGAEGKHASSPGGLNGSRENAGRPADYSSTTRHVESGDISTITT